jgi:hypothetical protein
MILVLYSPRIHCTGSNSGMPDKPSPFLSIYLCVAKYGNFMASYTSCLEYLSLSTPPTMLSPFFTPLVIFDITIPSYAYVCCTLFTLLYVLTLFFPCGDDTPHFGMSSCSISCSGFDSRPYCMEPMVGSTYCGPFPLDVSDSINSASSSGCSATCAGSFSSST